MRRARRRRDSAGNISLAKNVSRNCHGAMISARAAATPSRMASAAWPGLSTGTNDCTLGTCCSLPGLFPHYSLHTLAKVSLAVRTPVPMEVRRADRARGFGLLGIVSSIRRAGEMHDGSVVSQSNRDLSDIVPGSS
jgi:hypothetical protein